MRKITIITVLTGFCFFLSNCTGKTEKADSEVSDNQIVYKDTVHLTTALTNIRNYVNNCRKYLGDSVPIRAYTVNRADIFGILGVTSVPNCKYERCRVYIGMTSSNKFKLYMTPTVLKPTAKGSSDSTYVDLILYDSINRAYFVYDLNAPCPSTCDLNSKLFVRN